jgi:hypothetical protein
LFSRLRFGSNGILFVLRFLFHNEKFTYDDIVLCPYGRNIKAVHLTTPCSFASLGCQSIVYIMVSLISQKNFSFCLPRALFSIFIEHQIFYWPKSSQNELRLRMMLTSFFPVLMLCYSDIWYGEQGIIFVVHFDCCVISNRISVNTSVMKYDSWMSKSGNVQSMTDGQHSEWYQ